MSRKDLVKKQIDSNPRTVRHHYEHWPFPGTDFLSREGLLLLRYMHRWINRERLNKNEKVRVIDVGCGTGHTTAALAKNFPQASFLGIDVSSQSIQSAGHQASENNISNVAFLNKDIRQDLSSLGIFEIALCLGVLHHIEDANRAFRNIVQLLSGGGYLVLWLYGRLGRFGHNLNQEFLRVLTKNRGKNQALDMVRVFLKELGPRFVCGTGFYTPKGSDEEGIAWLMTHPEWMADQMIPAYEQGVRLREILDLFQENGLSFWKWLGVPTHLREFTSSPPLLESFEALPAHEKLRAIDCLLKPSYYLVVGKKVREG